MTVRGHLEPLAAVVRVGGDYGAPYTWAATVRYLSPTEVELLGVVRAPRPSECHALGEVLVAQGILWVTFRRMGVRAHRFPISRLLTRPE